MIYIAWLGFAVIGLNTATITFLAWHIWKAPRGYEDKDGFHLGDEEDKE